MNLLWKKDPNGTSYADIFASINIDPVAKMVQRLKLGIAVQQNKKSNTVSTKYRLEGNAKFDAKKWQWAMKFYNLSLRHAEIGSENVALAYANRSHCFLKLEMFDQCIADIELATMANYPMEKMPKLNNRRAYCTQQLEKAKPKKCGGDGGAPKLDFPADDEFHPGMANVLRMNYNEKFGRHFIAKCDIDVGKVIVVEDAFVNTIVMEMGQNICDTCFKHMGNFIACPKFYCTSGLFCNEICSEDFSHFLRCGRASIDDNVLVEFTIRSIGCVLDIFPTADQLMGFVEHAIKDAKKGTYVPNSIVDMKSKYRMFLNLNVWLGSMKEEDLIALGHNVFEILMEVPSVKEKFSSKPHNRFLMHLCVLHLYIIMSNSFQNPTTGGIFLLRNHFNHSCAPNVLTCNYGNKSICITSRRIKNGDQLFISYGPKYFTHTRAERQKGLSKDFGFRCECEKCKKKSWPISLDALKSDEEFQYLANKLDMKKIDFADGPGCSILKQKCMDILIKYCDHPWCIEKDLVAHYYQHLSVETLV